MKKLIILFIGISFAYGQERVIRWSPAFGFEEIHPVWIVQDTPRTAVKRDSLIVLPKQSQDTAYLKKKAEDMWNLGNAYFTWSIREDDEKRKQMLRRNATKFYIMGDSLDVEYNKLVIKLKYGK